MQQENNVPLTAEERELIHLLTKMSHGLNLSGSSFSINLNLPLNQDLISLFQLLSSSSFHPDSPSSPASPNTTTNSQIPEFKYIHVIVTDDAERTKINKMVFHIVRLPRMQLICDELYKLMKHRKVLCSIKPEFMLTELRRIGMQSADEPGFSDSNFYHYYRAPNID